MRIRNGLLILSLTLAGCTLAPPKPQIPKTVTIVVTKYVPVPEQLTKPCPIAEPKSREVEEALQVAHARKLSLQDCNSQLDQIRTLPPPQQKQ